ncbi:MAG: ABC transporter permease [Candidatus Omnitrophica bacterium]|nr:ABC transporter permease [Candidatus Omnitrophota bacterium]
MKNLGHLFKRDFTSYFYSPIAYVVLTVCIFFNGLTFNIILSFLNSPGFPPTESVMDLFFGKTIFFWLVALIVPPVLTMRLLSEEKKSGTIEVLMTAPVTDIEVVLAKFLAAYAFYLIIWVPTLLYPVLIEIFGKLDWGRVCAGYLAIAVIGVPFIAIGLLTSSLTDNQIIAVILSFVALAVLFSLGLLEYLPVAKLKPVFSYMSIWKQFSDFGRGIIDTRPLVYYLSIAVLSIFVTVRVVEMRRWK